MAHMSGFGYGVLARLPLGVEEPLQGRPATRFTREAGVVIGRPVVVRLALADFPAPFTARVDFGRWDYFHIRFPFDLEEARYGQQYIEAQYEVTLTDLDAVALQLEMVPLAYGADLFMAGEELATFGHGQRVFRWRLRPDGVGTLAEGSRIARVVLQLPPGLEALRGEIAVSATLEDAADPEEPAQVRQPAPQPFELDLADGAFVIRPETP